MYRLLTIIAIFITLPSCSTMFPYEDEFACKRKNNMGKCVSSMQAYDEIVNGDSGRYPYAKPASEQDDEVEVKTDMSAPDSGYLQYLQANYEQQKRLLDSPITPMIMTPTVLEILVMSYKSSNNRQLNGSRYIHVIVEDAKFIMGDYLEPKLMPIDTLF